MNSTQAPEGTWTYNVETARAELAAARDTAWVARHAASDAFGHHGEDSAEYLTARAAHLEAFDSLAKAERAYDIVSNWH